MFLMPPMYFILAGDIGLWPSAWYGRREKFLVKKIIKLFDRLPKASETESEFSRTA